MSGEWVLNWFINHPKFVNPLVAWMQEKMVAKHGRAMPSPAIFLIESAFSPSRFTVPWYPCKSRYSIGWSILSILYEYSKVLVVRVWAWPDCVVHGERQGFWLTSTTKPSSSPSRLAAATLYERLAEWHAWMKPRSTISRFRFVCESPTPLKWLWEVHGLKSLGTFNLDLRAVACTSHFGASDALS